MRIKILKINKDNIVEFSTSIGNGIGTCSNNDLIEGEKYDVEIDVEQVLKMGCNAKIVSDKICFISHNENQNALQGIVDDIDEDGMVYLRLTPDCLIMIENESTYINKEDYILLSVEAKEMIITPFGRNM